MSALYCFFYPNGGMFCGDYGINMMFFMWGMAAGVVLYIALIIVYIWINRHRVK